MVLLRQKRRFGGLAAAFGAAALTIVGPAYVRADETAAGQETTGQNAIVESVELSDAPLSLAINLIRQRTGINVAIKHSSTPYDKVTISIRHRPIGEVMRLMAESAGADFWEENGVYWFGPKGSAPKKEEKVEPVAPTETVSPAEDIEWEKIKLMYTEPHTLLRHLGINSGPLGDLSDMFTANAMRMLIGDQMPYHNTGIGNNVILQGNYAPGGNNGNYNQGNAANTVAPAVPLGNTNLPNSANVNADQAAHRDGGDFSDFGRGGQFGGQPGGGGRPGGGAGGAGGAQGQNGAATGLLPDGIQAGDILAYDADGSIIVRKRRGDDIPFRRLKELINLLDVKPRQIMVRAEFVTVTQNDQSSFGINWNFQKVNLIAGVNTGFTTPNTAFIQYAAGNLQTQLSWILTTGRGKIVAAPMATTLNNVPVSFQNVQQVPIFLSTPIISNNGTTALAPQLTFAQASTGLGILPRINGDDTITLFGSVFVSDLGTTVTGPNGESAPSILAQTAPIQRIIRNGDTLVIGGLTSKNSTVSTNRVPLLGDLPILGTLFRSRNVTTRDSDLLVFITASIIPERPTVNAIGGPGGGVPGIPGGGPGGAGGGLTP